MYGMPIVSCTCKGFFSPIIIIQNFSHIFFPNHLYSVESEASCRVHDEVALYTQESRCFVRIFSKAVPSINPVDILHNTLHQQKLLTNYLSPNHGTIRVGVMVTAKASASSRLFN